MLSYLCQYVFFLQPTSIMSQVDVALFEVLVVLIAVVAI